MRILNHISNDADVYKPVYERDIRYLEKALNFSIPDELKEIYLNPNLEFITQLGTTLLWPVPHDGIGILGKNMWLRNREYEPFPATIVAFATNECGDFWIIDGKDQSIWYMEPDESVESNLIEKKFHLENFALWLDYQNMKRSFKL